MSRGSGGLVYGLTLVAGALLLVLVVLWLVEPAAMPAQLRDHVCREG